VLSLICTPLLLVTLNEMMKSASLQKTGSCAQAASRRLSSAFVQKHRLHMS
jgi:hypothetical protein